MINATKKLTIPKGFQTVSEGQANILYKEEIMEKDSENMIKTQKGKRQANDQN